MQEPSSCAVGISVAVVGGATFCAFLQSESVQSGFISTHALQGGRNYRSEKGRLVNIGGAERRLM